MDLVIKGKNIDVTDEAREYIEKKARKFDRRLEKISKAKVELSEENTRSKDNRFVVEVTLDTQGTYLRAEERGPDIFSAVDSVATVMEKQLRRYKDRLQGKKRYRTGMAKTPAPAVNDDPAIEDDETEDEGQLIKFKRFPVEPMSPEEALDQMEMLGHTFFIFFNGESERFAVVYKRGDGDYGLIEPELA